MQIKNLYKGIGYYHKNPNGKLSIYRVFLYTGEKPLNIQVPIFDIDEFYKDRPESFRNMMIELSLIEIIFGRKRMIVKKHCRTDKEKDELVRTLKNLGAKHFEFINSEVN